MTDIVKRLRNPMRYVDGNLDERATLNDMGEAADEIEKLENQIKTLHRIIEVRNAVVLDDMRAWADKKMSEIDMSQGDCYEHLFLREFKLHLDAYEKDMKDG